MVATPTGASSIRRRLVAFVGLAALLILGGATYIGLTILQRSMADDENARMSVLPDQFRPTRQ